MRGVGIVAVALACALTVQLAGLPAAASAQGPQRTATRLKLDGATKIRAPGRVALNATLLTADGKPVSERSVDFFEEVAFMGLREMHLGSATTDSTGAAALSYQPARDGRRTINVRFFGDEKYAPSDASSWIEISEVVAPFHLEPLPFAALREWLPLGVGALVLGTWAVLLGAFVATVLGIKGARREAEGSRGAVRRRSAPTS